MQKNGSNDDNNWAYVRHLAKVLMDQSNKYTCILDPGKIAH